MMDNNTIVDMTLDELSTTLTRLIVNCQENLLRWQRSFEVNPASALASSSDEFSDAARLRIFSRIKGWIDYHGTQITLKSLRECAWSNAMTSISSMRQDESVTEQLLNRHMAKAWIEVLSIINPTELSNVDQKI